MRYAKLFNSYMAVDRERVRSDPAYKAKIAADVANWIGPSQMNAVKHNRRCRHE